MPVSRLLNALAVLVAVPFALGSAGSSHQKPDPNFNATVAQPAYTTAPPTVFFDQAHGNVHTMGGTYKPFTDLITNDGYKLVASDKPFSRQSLEGCGVLVIANPTGGSQRDAPAVSDAESDAVRDWVQAGGALLLIVDHPPFGGAAARLAGRFNVDVSPGYVIDKTSGNFEGDEQTEIVFSRDNQLLADHPITKGRTAGEAINRVILFSGTSVKGPVGSELFLKLSPTAFDILPPDPKPDKSSSDPADHREVSAAGKGQGVALESGKGRVVVIGDAAALTAQIGSRDLRYGMNYPGTDNRQLALNIMHWLSRLME